MGHSRETISISYHHSHGKQWKDPENVGASLSASCEQLVKYVCQKHIGRLAAVEIRDERVRKIIEGLAAALRIPPESPVVRVIHPSFYRYLTGDCKDPRFLLILSSIQENSGGGVCPLSQRQHIATCVASWNSRICHSMTFRILFHDAYLRNCSMPVGTGYIIPSPIQLRRLRAF